MTQVIMRRRTLLFVLAIYFNVSVICCYFNPLMDSEYFTIDWAGHESSKPDNVSTVTFALGILCRFSFVFLFYIRRLN